MSLEWINALFPKQAPLTKHQLALLAQGRLRSCKNIDALPSNAAPRADYILDSHPLWMMCFRSRDASGDKYYFDNLKKRAASGNRRAIQELADRTARLLESKNTLFMWISGLPEVIAEARRLEITSYKLADEIYRIKFPKHTSVDDLAEAVTSPEGIAVCKALVFNPFAELELALPPAAEESEAVPAPVLPPAAEEGTPSSLDEVLSCIERRTDYDESLYEPPTKTAAEILREEEELYLRRRAEKAAALPPAAEEGTLSLHGHKVYTEAELMSFNLEDKAFAYACVEQFINCPDTTEIPATHADIESGAWLRLIATNFIKWSPQMADRH